MLMMAASMLYGLLLLLFAASSWFVLTLAVMVLAGLCHVHSNALVQTVIQSYSPAEFRGRTLAMFSMVHMFTTVGSMLIGALALVLGARWAVAAMGMAGLSAMIAMHLLMPRARHIK
jgi:hypothetical protein